MDNGLFRKKSIDRISSPEALHDYMRVTSPRLWMILAAVVLLLAGFIIYASTANMENAIPVKVRLERYHLDANEETGDQERDVTIVTSDLPLDQMNEIKAGMKLRLGKEEGHVAWIFTGEGEEHVTVTYEMDHGFIPMDDGEYDGELILESTTPISFLWN